jgi:hypothetical protein
MSGAFALALPVGGFIVWLKRAHGIRRQSWVVFTNLLCDGASPANRCQSQLQELEGWRRRSGLERYENGARGRCHTLGDYHAQMLAKSELLTQRLPCGSWPWG